MTAAKDTFGYGSQFLLGVALSIALIVCRPWLPMSVFWAIATAIIMLFGIAAIFRHQWQSKRFWSVLTATIVLHALLWIYFEPLASRTGTIWTLLFIVPEAVTITLLLSWLLRDKSVFD